MLVSKYIIRSVRKKYGETQYQVVGVKTGGTMTFPKIQDKPEER